MTYRKISSVGGLGALAVAIVMPAAALAAGVVLQGDLIGFSATSGHGTVEYQANHRGIEAKLRINVQGVQNVDTVYVMIPNKFTAPISLDADGNGSLHLSTRRGDNVPALQAGDAVNVLVQSNGRTMIILKGILM